MLDNNYVGNILDFFLKKKMYQYKVNRFIKVMSSNILLVKKVFVMYRYCRWIVVSPVVSMTSSCI